MDELNHAWNSAFWGHTFGSLEEIFPPNHLGDFDTNSGRPTQPGLALDYRRFYGDSVRASYREEYDAIRAFDQTSPITTNFMGGFRDYDYFTWRDDVDIVSWDNYPAIDTSPSATAMSHDLMRGIGGQRPFMLMEQTPSRVNWQQYNAPRRPGQMRKMSWQAIAHGSDTIQFFQLRQSPGAAEKFHGAVIGSDSSMRSRTFQEVAALGNELGRVGGQIVASRVEPGQVAVISTGSPGGGLSSRQTNRPFDYPDAVERWYRELYARNIPVDIVSPRDDLSAYRAVIAPCLYLVDNLATERLRDYVEGAVGCC